MKNKVAFKFAASTAVLGLSVIGCKPAGDRVASASARAAKAEEGASKAFAAAQAAVQRGDMAGALALAERAVELAPRDAGYRMLLGDLYLKNGRFLSADNAFADVLALDPGNPRASLSRSLALIAQGKTGEATIELDRLALTAAPADVGLAFALAGQPQRAVEMLEPAARAPGATGRVRQNLALAYALAGEWQKARTVAAQDLSPAELAPRLEQWASFAKPTAPYTQVASLLGVNAVEDAGQPVRLALAPEVPAQAYAEAEPAAPAPAPAPEAKVQLAAAPAPAAPVQIAAAPVAAPAPIVAAKVAAAPAPAPAPVVAAAPRQPVQVAAAPAPAPAPAPFVAAAPRQQVQVAAVPAPAAAPAPVTAPAPRQPVEVAAAPAPEQPPVAFIPAPAKESAVFAAAPEAVPADVSIEVKTKPSAAPKQKLVSGLQFAAAVKSLVEKPAHVKRAAVRIAPTPIRAFQPKPKKVAYATGGRYVVQIGAYRNAAQVDKAWTQVQRRYGISGRSPVSTTVTIPGKGIFHRLAVSGFEAPADAARACQSIRVRGGSCFVRSTAGDAPIQWASRYTGRRA